MRPHLIHPVTVTVSPLDAAATTWDARAREQVPSLRRRATVTVKCQVHWTSQAQKERAAAGGWPAYDGWLAFRTQDLAAAGWAPAAGDRVDTVDGRAVELYLVGPGQDRGQYRRMFGGVARTLQQVPFEDRKQRHD